MSGNCEENGTLAVGNYIQVNPEKTWMGTCSFMEVEYTYRALPRRATAF
jgi:hypothetical protein